MPRIRALVGIVPVLCAVLLCPISRAADEKPIRALLVLGGCCHDYKNQKDILAKGISARCNIEITIAYDPDKTTGHENPVYDSADWYKGFDVIIHDECSSDIKDSAFIDRVLEPHKHGLPAVNLHCAMHCYRADPYPDTTAWMEFTGMNTNHHGQQRPIDVTFTDSASPITQGMLNWTTINEELYHPEKLLPTAHPLADGHQNVSREADAVVVWTNDYHGTRVFSTTLGHNNRTVGDPRYLDLVTRGLLWSLNKLDDQHFKKVPAQAPDSPRRDR
jgi:type 1 glutamine amidotransferase